MSSNSIVKYLVQPGGRLSGEFKVPGDKSISHRSIMMGALADGVTTVTGFLEGEDSLATLVAFKQMGVAIDGPANGRLSIHGVGMHGLKASAAHLDLGNSGTSMRLLAGLLCGQVFDSVLIGDGSLNKRPMRRVTDPLGQMGAVIEVTDRGTAPLHIIGGKNLVSIDYLMPMASAQVKSSLLLAGLYAQGRTTVTEPGVTRDHTERMLTAFGYPVEIDNNTVVVQGGGALTATNLTIPGDISSAAFFMVGACIAPDSDITLCDVGINPTRKGVLEILRQMGANITVKNERLFGNEPVADLRIVSSALKGIEIPESLVPLAIDEFPAIFVAAACAQGTTVLRGASELRVKESDRIQVMADGLQNLGIDAIATEDGMVIQGKGYFDGGIINSHGDHRIAMAFTMAGLCAKQPITVEDCANVNTSFPEFVKLACQVGVNVTETDTID